MKKKILNDVLIIRILLIFLLIIYHSFAIFNGGWEPLSGFPKIELYTWIADISYSFMLEMFVFISGLILGFQVLNRSNEFITKLSFLKKKAQRLLIPSIFFGILYVLIIDKEFNWLSVYKILNGYAHMWFLPMLFLCFCYIYIINKFDVISKWILLITIIVVIQPIPQLPFQITKSLYYFFFFFLGYLIGKREFVIDKFIRWRYFLLLLLFYFVTSIFFHIWKYEVVQNTSILQKILYFYIKRFISVLCALSGLFFVYVGINIWHYYKKNVLSEKYIRLSGYCFGVYLLQQFILKLLYNNSFYVSFCGPYMLPFVSFTITVVLSIFIVSFLLRTRLGRFLIA